MASNTSALITNPATGVYHISLDAAWATADLTELPKSFKETLERRKCTKLFLSMMEELQADNADVQEGLFRQQSALRVMRDFAPELKKTHNVLLFLCADGSSRWMELVDHLAMGGANYVPRESTLMKSYFFAPCGKSRKGNMYHHVAAPAAQQAA